MSIGARRNRGMTLIEIMIAFGLLITLGLGVMYIMVQMQKAAAMGSAKATAQELRRNMSAVLESEIAWTYTFMDDANRTFTCLRKNLNCNNDLVEEERVGRPFVVYDASKNVFFDGHNPNAGYMLGGKNCDKFPSRACPFRANLSWKAFCSNSGPGSQTCHPSQIEISAAIVYDPGADAPVELKMAYNPDNYTFRMIKNLSGGGDVGGAPIVTDTSSADHSYAPSSMQTMLDQQRAMICTQIAPVMRGQSTETIKATMHNMGYGDDMYEMFMQTLEKCK